MQTVPQHDHIDSSSEDGTRNMAPSSEQQLTTTYTSSPIDDSTLVNVIPPQSSISPTVVSISHPGSPSSLHVDGGILINRVKRSRSISSHSSTSDTDSDDERASKRHHSDSDEESVMMNEEQRIHEPVILKYEQHAIRVLMTNDGTRVVVAKDFLLLTGISKENCARTTKNLIEGRDKRMMHVPSNYCMNKGQQAVVLTLSGLSQLLVTSRRLKQSSVLQAWIKQTLMPVLRGEPTPQLTPTVTTQHHHNTHHVTPSTSSTNTSPTPTSSRRTLVVAKRSKSKSPSTSPVISPAATPTPSPRSSSRDMSPNSNSNSNDELVPAPHSPLHDLSAAAAAMLNIVPITMPKPINISTSASPPFLGFPMSTGFSTRVPTFPYRRTPLMGVGVGMGMGASMVLPRFTHPAAQQLGLGVRAVGA